MRRPARALVVALASASALGAVSVAGAAGPTGDARAIRLFRDVAARTNAEPAMQVVQAGYMVESAHVARPASFGYRWGFGTVPRGYLRATETITYTQHIGRVVWLTDVLAAQTCATCRPVPAIQLFVTKVAAFAGVVDRPMGHVGCYVREPFRNVPYRAGARWWTAIGAFRPLVERGNQILVTVTYAFASGQPVIERDSVDASTRLFTASAFHVGHGVTPSAAPFSFSQQDSVVTSAPPAPRVTLCR